MTMPEPSAPRASIVFDPADPDFSALAWNPTYSETRAQLMTDLYGHRYDGVQMTTINLPQTWPRWATLVSTLVPGFFVLCGVALFVTKTQAGTVFGQILVVFAGILGLIGIGIYGIIRYLARMGAEGYSRVKLERLAANNGLVYRHRAVPPRYPGCIFTTNTFNAYVYQDFSTSGPRAVDFGNYHPVSVSPDGPGATVAPPSSSSWGFLAIELQRDLPNLLLISKAEPDGVVALPVHPDPRLALSLEGDFDRYFTLYCPKERERDALYVITPDLMALLIDEAAPFDVEIVDNWMFFYSRAPFNLLDEDVYRRLFKILQTIGDKVIRQTGQYADSVVAAPSEVAAQSEVAAPSQVAVDTMSASVPVEDPPRHLANRSGLGPSGRNRLVGTVLVTLTFTVMVVILVLQITYAINH